MESKVTKQVCCICGKTFFDYGNNPMPIKDKGKCCDDCNITKVVPARITFQEHNINQYHKLKEKHPTAVILFRLGDFYECFEKDAKKVSAILGTTLTYRNNIVNKTTYEGAVTLFHFTALDDYLPKLIRAGMRIAICDMIQV